MPNRGRILPLGVLLAVFAALVLPSARASPPACSDALQRAGGSFQLQEDCSWHPDTWPQVAPPGASGGPARVVVGLPPRVLPGKEAPHGVEVRSGSPPAVLCEQATAAATTTDPTRWALHLTGVVLVDCPLPSPLDEVAPLQPRGLLPAAAAGAASHQLHLQDVRILVTADTLLQHVRYLKANVTGFDSADANEALFTDGASFLHVRWWSDGVTAWESVGLLLADSLAAARATAVPATAGASGERLLLSAPASADQRHAPAQQLQRRGGGNATAAGGAPPPAPVAYVLWAENSTIVQLLQQHASVSTPLPLLVYVAANVTLGPRRVPEAGIPVNRPLHWVGLSSANTSVDVAVEPNQLLLTGRWSNMTSQHLVYENLPLGNKRSAEIAKVLSIGQSSNLWFLAYDRRRWHHAIINCTLVIPPISANDISAMVYWGTLFNSDLAAWKPEREFMRHTMGVSVFDFQVVKPDVAVVINHFHSNTASTLSCLVTTEGPLIAPAMPMPLASVRISRELDNNTRTMPMMRSVDNPRALLEMMATQSDPSLRGDILFVLANMTDVSPANAQRVACGHTVMGLDDSHAPTSTSSNVQLDFGGSVGSWQLPASAGGLAGQDHSGHAPMDAGSSAAVPCLTLQQVQLRGLPQGPAAAEATTWADPNVWSLLVWPIQRARLVGAGASPLVLSQVVLSIPAPEFHHLAQLASSDSPVVLPLTDGYDLSIADIVSSGPELLHVGSITGAGLSASNVTLELLELADYLRQVAPHGRAQHYWPAGLPPGSKVGGAGSFDTRAGLLAAILVPVLLVLALAALALVLLSRRHPQRRLWEGAFGDKPGPAPCPMGPSSGAASKHRDLKPGHQVAADACVGRCPDLPLAPECAAPPHTCVRVWDGVDRQSPGSSKAPDNSSAGAVASTSACTHAPVAPSVNRSQSGSVDLADPMDTSALHGSFALSTRLLVAGQRMVSAINTFTHQLHGKRQQGLASSVSSLSASAALHASASSGAAASSLSGRAPIRADAPGGDVDELQLLKFIGRGTFAAVYQGVWRGRVVAVKVLHVSTRKAAEQLVAASGTFTGPGPASGAPGYNALESCALREVAVSAITSHPTIVQVYGHRLVPLQSAATAAGWSSPNDADPSGSGRLWPRCSAAGAGAEGVAGSEPLGSMESAVNPNLGWELQLIMEYCDQGTLREALDAASLVTRRSSRAGGAAWPDQILVVGLAIDIASALLHLHSEGLVHGDLKAQNVLLAGSVRAGAAGAADLECAAAGAAVRGPLVAKVSDFGLTLSLDADATHISNVYVGTLSHMAPELLMSGQASKASDMYAMGVLLWELATGRRAWAGTPCGMLPTVVTQQGERPAWPPGAEQAVPAGLRQVVEAAWAQHPTSRPTAEDLLHQLVQLQQQLTWQFLGAQVQEEEAAPPEAASASKHV